MKLELYMFESCPYCRRVMKKIHESRRTDIDIHDIHKSSEDHEWLLRAGGKDQVPCLFINSRPLYESLDIIDWLDTHPQERR